MNSSTALENIAVDVSNLEGSPAFSLDNTAEPAQGTLPNGDYNPASYTPSTNTITVNTGLLDYGSDYLNQSSEQIIFHEYDHAYYDHTTRYSDQFNPTMSATIGGVTYTWLIYKVDASGAIEFNSSSYDGYQHMLIHDDLVAAYGSDDTGSLQEALTESQNAPKDPAGTASENKSQRPSFPAGTATQKARPIPPVTSGTQTCHTQQSARRIDTASVVDFLPFIGIQY